MENSDLHTYFATPRAVLSLEGEILDFNEEFGNIFNFSTNIDEIFPQFTSYISQNNTLISSQKFEKIFSTLSGGEYLIRGIENNEDIIIECITFSLDPLVNQRSNTNTNSQESYLEKDYFEKIFKTIGTDIVVINREGKFEYISPSAIKDEDRRSWALGRTNLEYVRNRGLEISIGINRDKMVEKTLNTGEIQYLQEKFVFENSIEYVKRVFVPYKNEKGEVVKVVAYGIYNTEAKLMEEQLKKTNVMLNTFKEETSEGILIFDEDHQLIAANDQVYELWEMHEYRNLPYEEQMEISQGMVKNRDIAVKQVNRAMNDPNYSIENQIVELKSGRILARSTRPLKEDDNIIGRIWVYKDITEILQLQNQQIMQDKLKSIGILAGGIAHDYNNHLTSISINTDLLKLLMKKHKIEIPEFFDLISNIKTAINNSKGMANQLLTFSKGGQPIMKVQNIVTVLENSINLFLSGKNIEYISRGKDKVLVNFDRQMLHNVFSNLILNSIVALQNVEKPRITSEIEIIRSSEVSIRLIEKHYVRIILSDNGKGISKHNLDKIFDPYFTTRDEGTGLGLSIVYSVIKRHNGKITVESEVGKGTSFTIYLPLYDAKEGELEENINNQLQLIQNKKILIMDDDASIREIFTRTLEMEENEVYSTSNGEEALVCLEKYDIDIAILDLTIKGGKGGAEIIDQAKQLSPKTKFVVCSGYSHNAVINQYESYGFDARMTKPVTRLELLRTLGQIN